MDELEKIDKTMDIERTDKLFDNSIKKGGSLEEGAYTEDDVKKQRLVIGFGNLHIKTASVKMSALRMIGYQNNLKDLKNNVTRKIRNSRKYGK